MPYRTIRDLPAQFDGVPEHGKRIALNVINSMLANGATEEQAFAAAWSQIKRKYKKEGGKWVLKETALQKIREIATLDLHEASRVLSAANAAIIRQIVELARKLLAAAGALEVADEDEDVTEAEKPKKTENGVEFPAAAYAYVPDPNEPSTWKLRLWEDPVKKITAAQVGRAIAALGKGFRGQKVEIPEEDLPAVKAKVRAAWRKANPDAKEEDMPDVIKESGAEAALREVYYPNSMESLLNDIRMAVEDKDVKGFCDCSKASDWDYNWSTLNLEATGLDGTCVVSCRKCNSMWIANYGRDDEGKIVFTNIKQAQQVLVAMEGRREEVEIDETAVALREAAGMDEDGVIRDACLIQPGWGACGYYSKDMLARDAHMLVGAQMFIDHPTPVEESQQPERSLKTLAGVVVGPVTFKEGWKGPGLYGPIKVFSDYREPIREKAPYIGLSVYGSGKARIGEAEGRTGKIIEAFTKIRSVDFVTVAGAGGALPIIESAREELRKKKAQTPKDLKSATLADLREVRPDLIEAIEVEIRESQSEGGQKPMGENQELVQLKETVTQLKETVTQLEEKNKKQEHENAKLRESVLLRDAGDEADLLLREAKIPDVTKARLRRECLLSIPVAEGGGLDKAKFQEAVKAKIAEAEAEFAAIVGSGRVVGLGGGSGPTNIKESVASKLNKMFGVEEEKKTSEQK